MRKTACDCGWEGIDTQLLRAPDPFNPGQELFACPDCRQTTEFYSACEHDGCWQAATCGGTHKDGVYRFTCGKHAEWLRELASP